MVTQKDVELADQVGVMEKQVKQLRWDQEAARRKEEERAEEFRVRFYSNEGKIREAEAALERAAQARTRILHEVPIDLRRDADRAAADARQALASLEDARSSEAVAKHASDLRMKGSPSKDEVARMASRLEDVAAARKRAEEMHKLAERRRAEAQAKVDLGVQQVRKAAKK